MFGPLWFVMEGATDDQQTEKVQSVEGCSRDFPKAHASRANIPRLTGTKRRYRIRAKRRKAAAI